MAESELEAFFNLSPDLFCIIAPDGHFRELNPAWERVLGWSREELMLRRCSEIVHPDDLAEGTETPWYIFVAADTPGSKSNVFHFENRYRHKDGSYRWLSWSASKSENGILYATGRDITEQPLAQALATRYIACVQLSEQKFRSLYEASLDAVMWLDEDSFFDCNPATLKMFGCKTSGQFCGKHPSEFSPPLQPGSQDSASLFAYRIFTALEQGSCCFEWQHQRLDGSEFPAEVLLTSIEIGGRKVLQAIVRDITARKQAEEENTRLIASLQESEKRFRRVFDEAPIGMVLAAGSDHKLFKVNQTFCNLVGYSALELAELTFTELTHPEDREKERVYLKQISSGEIDCYHLEKRFIQKTGKVRWANLTCTVFRDPAGKVLYGLGMAEDITDRKAAEEEKTKLIRSLQESEARLEAIVDQSTAVIYLKDLQGRYILINRRYETLFHISKEQIVGKTDYDMFPKEYADQWRKNDQKVLELGTPLEIEEVISPDEEIHTYLSIKFALYDAAGIPYAVCGISTNISDRKVAESKLQKAYIETRNFASILEKRVEERTAQLSQTNELLKQESNRRRQVMEALLQAKQKAEAANRAKSTFLANMSHELRTPLNAIIGYSDIIQEEAEDLGYTDVVPDLKKIRTAGKHLLSVINDLLDLSKIEAGQMALYLETFDVRGLVENVITTTQPLIQKRGNTLIVQCDEAIGTMYADLTKVQQVLLNLLSNAAKFTSGGKITLTVRKEEQETIKDQKENLSFIVNSSSFIVLTIADTGIGMTPEQAQHIFEAFTQADASTTRKYGGTGLGLAISRQFCQLMGGHIDLQSEVDRGSTFTVYFPVEVVDRRAPSLPVVTAPNVASERT